MRSRVLLRSAKGVDRPAPLSVRESPPRKRRALSTRPTSSAISGFACTGSATARAHGITISASTPSDWVFRAPPILSSLPREAGSVDRHKAEMQLEFPSTDDFRGRPSDSLYLGPLSLLISYHDTEWGVPVRDDDVLFEFLTLEGGASRPQLGDHSQEARIVSRCVRRLRSGKSARFTPSKIERLLQNPGIVRNRSRLSAPSQ